MNIEKLLGKNLPPVLTELLALLLSEWMTILSRKQEKENPQKYKERDACFDNWEKVVKEHCPEPASHAPPVSGGPYRIVWK